MNPLVLVAVAAGLASADKPAEPPRASAALSPPAAAALASGRQAEAQARTQDALRAYREAVAAGSGEAAKRIGDIYWHGAPGVERDLAESLRWYREAEVHGERVAQAVRLR